MTVVKPKTKNPSGRELTYLNDAVTGVTQASVPATGSNAAQFSFFNADGQRLNSPRLLDAYMSDINGAPVTAITSWVGLVNGYVDPLVSGKIHNVITSAIGLLGVTFTGTAATRYCTFVLPNGKLLISGPIIIN